MQVEITLLAVLVLVYVLMNTACKERLFGYGLIDSAQVVLSFVLGATSVFATSTVVYTVAVLSMNHSKLSGLTVLEMIRQVGGGMELAYKTSVRIMVVSMALKIALKLIGIIISKKLNMSITKSIETASIMVVEHNAGCIESLKETYNTLVRQMDIFDTLVDSLHLRGIHRVSKSQLDKIERGEFWEVLNSIKLPITKDGLSSLFRLDGILYLASKTQYKIDLVLGDMYKDIPKHLRKDIDAEKLLFEAAKMDKEVLDKVNNLEVKFVCPFEKVGHTKVHIDEPTLMRFISMVETSLTLGNNEKEANK